MPTYCLTPLPRSAHQSLHLSAVAFHEVCSTPLHQQHHQHRRHHRHQHSVAMNSQQTHHHHPPLTIDHNTYLPPIPSRTASSTPMSSPGLFSPVNPRPNVLPLHPSSDGSTPAVAATSPYLHPLQTHRVREYVLSREFHPSPPWLPITLCGPMF